MGDVAKDVHETAQHILSGGQLHGLSWIQTCEVAKLSRERRGVLIESA
jgi:hypothetical protein